ncbi:TonB-dependent receptor family protein [Pseudoduganella danionis]|uniref:TonB-dependent receptor n=1 Tax=Pseudoduganella danionis TaxID=1890295 RepID=A0ABW9SMG5_9BURK|nr:TonB-dependent receptor [Pseudoduganella danionis]MTW33341.1 TonB-dependent receptor [Pseudoduganella danionis]
MPVFPPRRLAAAVALCFTSLTPLAALAQEIVAAQVAQVLAPVIVTGSRFDADPALAPIGAVVIHAEDIQRAGVSDVNAAIRKIGGVYGRQSLDGSPDFSLDLRGFGTNSSQNMVIVLDGVRLSENELSNAILSTIPIDSVERIEITRGGASVLYGDGATGGVVNIVTRRPVKFSRRGTMFVEGGQFGAGELRLSGAHAWEGFAADATLDTQRTDNYRDNNVFKQTQFAGGAQWFDDAGRAGFRYEGARQDMGLPGSLTAQQFASNPRQASTPNDAASLDSDRLTVFGQRHFGAYDVAADLSYRKKHSKGTYYSPSLYVMEYDSKQTQFSPRVRHLGNVAGLLNETVAGVDLMYWTRVATSSYSADANQHSKAIYLRDELRFDAAHQGRISAGVRRELFDKNFRDPFGYGSKAYSAVQAVNAWELQASYMPLAHTTVFGKAGQSYRLATSDENAYPQKKNQPLEAQQSHDLELGASYASALQKLTARVFRHQLVNEIFYDQSVYANVNLAPTRRQGFELDAEQRINADWTLNGHYQHVDASFTEGSNNGKQMVLVPKNTLSARISWTPASGQTADLGAQWVDSQRFGNDFTNQCNARIPSYTTFDARYARTYGQWEVAVQGLNLTDKHYYSQAFDCNGAIYPADGRQFKLSARYTF